MYTVDEKIVKSILNKKFNSFVGMSCETTEKILNEDLDKKIACKLIKDALKKYAYTAMRDIEGQISAFSNGVNININLKKPVSK